MKIWIDLDNTPHVPFFKPIMSMLEKHGHVVVLSARDAFQVFELASLHGLEFKKIGKHYGKNALLKAFGLCFRALQLLPFVVREKPELALSHGSRSQILLCNLLRIPTVMIMDYEHALTPGLLRPRWEIVPFALFSEEVQCENRERVLGYEGIKEDVYAPEFQPDWSLPDEIGLTRNDIIVTVRPPASEAHYHNQESDSLFAAFMTRAEATQDVTVILLPRNKIQESKIRSDYPQWFKSTKVIVPQKAVDGLNLLWHSDLVVSGGGTMNREAAALGIPVYSIFRGKTGAVDRQLQNEGRLVLIENINQVQSEIKLERRSRVSELSGIKPGKALSQIVGHVEDIMCIEKLKKIKKMA